MANIVRKNRQAMKNLKALSETRKAAGLTLKKLSSMTGIDRTAITHYENGRYAPTLVVYNVLADVFGWEKLERPKAQVKPKHQPKSYEAVQHEDAKPTELPKVPEYTFEVGKSYAIEHYVFRYESKHGIHHIFREVNNGWQRTYTDAQLIGKEIEEE